MRLGLLIAIAAVLTLGASAPVQAATAHSVSAASGYPQWVLAIRDCANDGQLDGTYSEQALKTAISRLSAFEDEYYGCTDVLRHALEGGSGKHEPAPPNGIVTDSGAVAAAPEDVAALQNLQAAVDAGEPLPAATPSGRMETNTGAAFVPAIPMRDAASYPLWVARDALLVTLASLVATLCLYALRRRRATR